MHTHTHSDNSEQLDYLYPPKHMVALDYSRLFQTVPELDCATTNTLTVIGDTLSGSMPFY